MIFANYNIYWYAKNKRETKIINEIMDISTPITRNNTISEEVIPSDNNSVVCNDCGVLEIPIINLSKLFFPMDNPNNNVDKNVQVLDGSLFPDQENSILALAAHSGYGYEAFFDDLDQLSIGNDINIYYHHIKYNYQIIKIYKEIKDGNISIEHSNDQLLVLTTCDKKDKTKQLVIVAKLNN